MDQVMHIVKLIEFSFLKKEVEESGQQSKNLDCQNRRLEHLVEVLNDQNNICECIMSLFSLFLDISL